MRILVLSLMALTLGFAQSLTAGDKAEVHHQERPDHFEGKPSNTLEEAVANFSEYNKRLNEILIKKQITPEDMLNIHILTYTIENALQKIIEETGNMAVSLENLHLSSETGDLKGVRNHGSEYSSKANKLIK